LKAIPKYRRITNNRFTVETDFLVIGSGIAGLTYALKAAEFGKVAIITKKEEAESNTNYAQGGIAAVFGKNDSFDLHIQDTLKTGAGLCDEKAVRIMVKEGPRLVKELFEVGVSFTQKKETFDLRLEGGHSRNRIVHSRDLTGKEIENALISRINEHPNISTYENHLAVDLLVNAERGIRICNGAAIFKTTTGKLEPYYARVTLLATGGAGQVYLHTTNPRIATGDGIAMAYRAGATIANMEFVQFHPTSLFVRKDEERSFLISEAVRGEGGILKTRKGTPFMEKYSEKGNLASRDIVARAIDMELKKRGEDFVLLDLTHLPARKIRNLFPNIYDTCMGNGIDITVEPIPVVPAAHYICGGVLTDIDGMTSIEGLYAAGETACTRVHGANRLASNSLLEAVVFSERAFKRSVKYFEKISKKSSPSKEDVRQSLGTAGKSAKPIPDVVILTHVRDDIRRLLWNYAGIVRKTSLLKKAKREISSNQEEIEELLKSCSTSPELIELRNMATTAELIVQSAVNRKESRGLHYNTDFPERDDQNWKKDTLVTQSSRLKNSY
jgi:L-aspartate oxidase